MFIVLKIYREGLVLYPIYVIETNKVKAKISNI